MKMAELIKEAKKVGLTKVVMHDYEISLDRFEKTTRFFQGDYQLFNDPMGGRITRLDEPGEYFLK